MRIPTEGMRGNVVVVTGASSGIGEEAALGIAKTGASVILVGRDEKRLAHAASRVARESGSKDVQAKRADFRSLADVRRLADDLARGGPIHVLVNNAGVIEMRRHVTPDGFEATFAVNHLAPFLLTNLLIPKLRLVEPARVVTVASSMHYRGHVSFEDLQLTRGFNGVRAYAQSKLANVLFASELARRLENTRVTSNAVHPGAVATRFGRGNVVRAVWNRANPFLISSKRGAEPLVALATSPDVDGVTGRFFNRMKIAKPSREARDVDVQKRLWEESAKLVGL